MSQEVIQISQNYEGKRYLAWLNGDCLSAQNILNTLFRGGLTTDSTEYADLLKASEQTIADLEEDTAKLKEILNTYTQPEQNQT